MRNMPLPSQADLFIMLRIDTSKCFCYTANMDIDDPRVEVNIGDLADAMAKTHDSGLINEFLRCLLTPAEIADIAGRWALVKALQQKIPQREIARDLGVSLCKITRGSRELKKPESAFQKMLVAQQ
jgi:TrpR family trp operon transcriptional repressor